MREGGLDAEAARPLPYVGLVGQSLDREQVAHIGQVFRPASHELVQGQVGR